MDTKEQIQELQERVITLEVRSAYQEKTIDTLDKVIQEQFKLIDTISDELKHLKSKVDAHSVATRNNRLEDEVPPHY